MKTKPKYKHDCEHCVYIGSFNLGREGRTYDAYICARQHNAADPSLIARYGSRADKYISAPVSVAAKIKPLNIVREML